MGECIKYNKRICEFDVCICAMLDSTLHYVLAHALQNHIMTSTSTLAGVKERVHACRLWKRELTSILQALELESNRLAANA